MNVVAVESAPRPRFTFYDVFRDPSTLFKFTSVLGLQMGQMFPAAFFGLMLPGIFRAEGLALSMMWVFTLPSIPSVLRPLWAPLVDRLGHPGIGMRKTWFIPCTTFGALAYLSMALWAPSIDNLAVLIAVLVVKSTFMTTQDIAIDGYMVENLEDHERGVGAAVMDIGRNVASFSSWAGIAWIYGAHGWNAACVVAAGLLVLFALPGIIRREPPRRAEAMTARPSLLKLLKRPDSRLVIPLVMLIAFVGMMIPTLYVPYLVDLGFSVTDIGVKIFAPATLIGSLIGASLASWFIGRFGYKRTILTAAILMVPTVIPIMWMGSLGQPGYWIVFLVTLNGVTLPSLFQVAMAASRLKWASKTQAATDYTTLIVAMIGAGAAATAIGGVLAEHVGWFWYFFIAGTATSVACLIFYYLFDPIEARVDERDRQELGRTT